MQQPNEQEWTRADLATLSFEQRKEIALRITAERKARNITQEGLARLAGVPLRTVSYVEGGKAPQAGTLRKLANALSSTARGKSDDASALKLFTDLTAPMYLQLSERGRARAIREILLLLGAVLHNDQGRLDP